MITAAVADELFSRVNLVRVLDQALPPGISHSRTRLILSTAGLPKYVGYVYKFASDAASRFRDIAAVYRSHGDEPPAGVQGQYHLGFVGNGFLCVHGESGVVSQVDQGYGARPMATGLENFLRVLAVVDAGVSELEEDEYQGNEPDWAAHFSRIEAQALARLHELEPYTAAGYAAAWRSLFAADTDDA